MRCVSQAIPPSPAESATPSAKLREGGPSTERATAPRLPFNAISIDRVVRAGRGAALIDAIVEKNDAARAFERRADLPAELRDLFIVAYNERLAEIAA